MTRFSSAALLGSLLVPIVVGCSSPPPSPDGTAGVAPPDRSRASLLFVSLDTFRGDAAGCGGSPAARTPHLDRLARTGLQFEAGLSSSPLTLPSHATMLTGLNPPAHGIRDNGTFRLAETIPTLAEGLSSRGITPAAFIAAIPLDKRFGLDRGFSIYDDDTHEISPGRGTMMAQRPGTEVVASATRWWNSNRDSGRWFTWVHLFDAHTPYDAPRPLLNACGRDTYRADVALADRSLGDAVRQARTTREELWVIVVGDHGEGLGDHRENTHGVFIYGSTIQVPAVIWPAPAGLPPGVRRGHLRMLDVAATVFDLLDLRAQEAPGVGRSGLSPGSAPAYAETYYPLYHYGWAPLRSVRSDGWKYVEAPDPELYDLAADPGEQSNVIDDHPDRADELAALVADLTTETGPAPTNLELDDEARAALESLGYVTTTPAARPDAPDPKRMIMVQLLFAQAQALNSAGQPQDALGPLRAAYARDPDNKDIHQLFGTLYTALGNHAAATDSFLRCLELPPHQNDRIPRFELASAYVRLGQPEKALPHLETLLKILPVDASTWHNLGVVRNSLGDSQAAREAWRRALGVDPGYKLSREALESQNRSDGR